MTELTEFEFIECYITNTHINRSDIVLAAGDDAAIVDVPSDKSLVITVDSMIEGRHFLPNTPANVLGYRILAVNLSDLAAMGADPAWATLALTIPQLETEWLDGFFAGFYELANRYNIALIGGNTAKGPLNLTMQLHGFVPKNKSLRRSGARVGDKIIATGTLGDAALALNYLRGEIKNLSVTQKDFLLNKLYYPKPRIELGQALLDHATAAIDISDGLAADLNHILQASEVGAHLELSALPCSNILKEVCDHKRAQQYSLYTGEAYELCFTLPPEELAWLEKIMQELAIPFSIIGEIVEKKAGFTAIDENNATTVVSPLGWDHFK